MAITQNTFTGNGSNLGPFSFTFKWLESTDIKVTVAGVLKTAGTHYNLQSLNYTTRTGGQVLFTAGNAPANGAAIIIFRQTDDTDLVSTFYSGSAIRARDLNDNFTQALYKVQETTNYSVQDAGNITLLATYTFSNPVSGQTPVNNNHLATKAYVDGIAFNAGSFTTGDKGALTVNSASNWTLNPVTGAFVVNETGSVRFMDADASNWVALQSPTTVTSNVTWRLPATDGSTNQVLSTNGSGSLGWQTPASGGVTIGLAIALG